MTEKLRSRLLAATGLALALSVMPVSAWAQDAATTQVSETIIVTGSRIARADYTEPVPVQTITAADISRSGQTNVVNYLRDLPAVGTSTFSGTNSNFDVNNSGVETLNLRNLGDQRTLVLVDGRRWVAGVAGDTSVDFNSIPTQFIDRVEVITGGASAVYGSEAIAGVVNIITKDKFEGVSAQAQYGFADRGGGEGYQASVLAGTSFADDRGHVLVTLGYDKTEAIYSRQRKYTAIDNLRDPDTGDVTRPQYSSYGPGGRFWTCGDQFCDTGYAIDSSGALQPFDSLLYGYNRDGQRLIQVPTERYQVATKLSYEITPDITLFGELYYTNTKSDATLEAFPLGNDDVYDDDTTVGVPITNPLIPAALRDEALLNGATSIPFFRRLADYENRGATNDRDTYRAAIGAKGAFSDINWDVSYVRGEFKQHQVSSGQVNVPRVIQAFDAITDGAGNVVCADAAARAAGCAPLNIFGPNTISAAAKAYILAPGIRDAKITEDVFSANLSGKVFELPAGPIGWAAGVEYRNEESKAESDILTQTGDNAGNATPNVAGSYDVKEAYAEFLIPVFKDMPWIYSANVEAAARIGDYSTVGEVFSWKAGGDYSPVKGLMFRATYAEASRAPNIGELYDPGSQDFPTVFDICTGVTATSTRPQDANCRAVPGMLDRIALDGGEFTPNQTEQEGVTGFEGGNPKLNEETAKTFTVGFVYQPSFIPKSALTVDFYDIKVDDAIAQVDQNYAVAQCYLTNNPTFCNTITRNNRAVIIQADGTLANVASIKVQGLDVSAIYTLPLETLGLTTNSTIDFKVAYNHVFKNSTKAVPDAPEDDLAGYLGAADNAGGPFNRATLDMVYHNEGLSFDWTVRWVGKTKLGTSTAPLVFGGTTVDDIEFTGSTIEAQFYHDIQLRYDWSKYSLYAGMKNVLDEDPPIIGEGIPGVVTGTATSSNLYDVIGRSFYIGLNAKF